MSETPGTVNSQREAYVWIAVLSIPPGLGMVGFTSIALSGGALTPTAVGAGLATTLILGGLIYAMLQVGPDEDTALDPRN